MQMIKNQQQQQHHQQQNKQIKTKTEKKTNE